MTPEAGLPASEAVTLQRATRDAAPLLQNLLELYLHDMSEFFPVEPGPDGRFGYEKLELYWTQPAVRQAFLIQRGGRVAGFALATRGSPASDDPAVLGFARMRGRAGALRGRRIGGRTVPRRRATRARVGRPRSAGVAAWRRWPRSSS